MPGGFPADIAISWDFLPRNRDSGLAMFFFAAAGRKDKDLFDPSLARRVGRYPQYHHGDINAFHFAYYRPHHLDDPDDVGFPTVHLRKSYGFHLLCQGLGPLTARHPAAGPVRIQVVKFGPRVHCTMGGLTVLEWEDDGKTYGPMLGGGKIGFRQMTGLIADYANLEVRRVRAAT